MWVQPNHFELVLFAECGEIYVRTYVCSCVLAAAYICNFHINYHVSSNLWYFSHLNTVLKYTSLIDWCVYMYVHTCCVYSRRQYNVHLCMYMYYQWMKLLPFLCVDVLFEHSMFVHYSVT